jgi:pimeloyl-ACP methyl ester carboxylesterase
MSVAKPEHEVWTQRDGNKLGYVRTPGYGPGIVFLGGFMSDMAGIKATFLEKFCREEGKPFLRFDYFGHGVSGGEFHAGTIGRWKDDVVDVLDNLTEGPQILIGSSMGGWLMILAALQRKEKIAGLMGIATAADFIQPLIWDQLTSEQQYQVLTEGVFYVQAPGYEKPYPISKELIEEGTKHEILNDNIDLQCPVRLIHGLKDLDVPWQYSQKLMDKLVTKDVTLNLVKNGDHRLSKPHELNILKNTLNELCETVNLNI